jgi:23S rRNA pseudouridine955/2504/2580 synthase/23S rRNA pseudouridine1911/1915/1917 synthase
VSGRIERYESRGARWEDEFVEDGAGTPRRRERRAEPVEVLVDDPAFSVVAKPSGVPTVPERFLKDRRTIVDLVAEIWRRADPAAAEPVVCHRLDRDTSGCLVLAKDRETARTLMESFRQRTVSKTYLALVLGAPQPPAGEVEFLVAPDRFRPGAMAIVPKKGKECRDAYETLETFRGLALVRVTPKTGRTHEVRLAMKHLGCPCAIDPLYGGREPILLSSFKRGYRVGRDGKETPLVERLTLHAATIEFPHPSGTGTVRAEAPLPRDLDVTLRQLRRHAAPGSL